MDLDKILDASKRSLEDINSAPSHKLEAKSLGSDLKLISGMETSFEQARRSLDRLSFVARDDGNSIETRRIALNKRISSHPNAFGQGFLLSVINDISHVRVVEDVKPGVIQNIFESVLNGSKYLDVSFHAGANISRYYFAKPSKSRYFADKDNVNRLAGEYEVSERDLDKSGDKDLIIKNKEIVLHVIYGQNVDRHRDSIRSSLTQETRGLAWAREKNLAQSGFTGNGDWTKAQRAELVMGHRVRGFGAVEIFSGQEYPSLIRDASNFFFAPDSQNGQRRRKSRHGKARGRH